MLLKLYKLMCARTLFIQFNKKWRQPHVWIMLRACHSKSFRQQRRLKTHQDKDK